MRTPLIVANFKMNLGAAETAAYLSAFVPKIAALKNVEVGLAPQAPLLSAVGKGIEGSGIRLAAQNCGVDRSGAYTAELSPVLLKELGITWVILGHSERRHVYGESDTLVQNRFRAALKEGLQVILCVGETLEERKAQRTLVVVARQLEVLGSVGWPSAFDYSKFAVAYEPVWAIGTGETATPEQAQEVHRFIRGWLAENINPSAAELIRIQYGGSVKPDNAGVLMSQKDVDGLLVGSASLKADGFAEIVRNAVESRR